MIMVTGNYGCCDGMQDLVSLKYASSLIQIMVHRNGMALCTEVVRFCLILLIVVMLSLVGLY